jgi:glycosyltransferase involved in cell wall biosynthesis
VGAQSEPQNYIQRFDIALLCSESEGFSNAIIECLQFGKPVVCSRTGGNPEIVSEGENGFLYTVGDVTELANCIRHLLTEPALLAQMSQQAMQSVASRFSMTNMLVRHEQLYQQIIAEGSND